MQISVDRQSRSQGLDDNRNALPDACSSIVVSLAAEFERTWRRRHATDASTGQSRSSACTHPSTAGHLRLAAVRRDWEGGARYRAGGRPRRAARRGLPLLDWPDHARQQEAATAASIGGIGAGCDMAQQTAMTDVHSNPVDTVAWELAALQRR